MIDPSPAMNLVRTAYGSFSAQAFAIAQAQVDLPGLLRSIMELDAGTKRLQADADLRDALAKLYCICATMFCGAAVTVPPSEESLGELVKDVRDGLTDSGRVLDECSRVIEPLERLLAELDPALPGC